MAEPLAASAVFVAGPGDTAGTVGRTAPVAATIEQAKGALMLAYGLSADAAFERLRIDSQRRNIKVRDLAGNLVCGLEQLALGSAPRRQMDRLIERAASPLPAPSSEDDAVETGPDLRSVP